MQIEMTGIHKSFGAHQVLKDSSFHLKDGEVHALMGENGAGKSTLMKILTGVYTRDQGKVLVDGQEVTYHHPKEAEQEGIVFIHQELNVLFDLTVEENMFLGKEQKGRLGICRQKEMQNQVKTILEQLGVTIDPKETMSNLSVGQQQMIEIAKALLVDAKVIIMDEPTAALTQRESEVLFGVIRSLRKRGVSIVYISHRMEEIFELCDRITVLRDGNYVDTKEISHTNMNDVVRMMIGREIGERYPVRSARLGQTVLKVEALTKKGLFHKVSFEVRAGEILGVSGLMGAGRTEIMHAIFGDIQPDEGRVMIQGKVVSIKSPKDGMKYGIGFITEDRKSEGLMLDDSIRSNITLPNLKHVSKRNIMKKQEELRMSEKGITDMHIKCTGPEHICQNLSGGNQQKVVLAKWISANPQILILDEPTRGVDIGAKKEIYTIINQLAEQGVAVIMVSSELPEVIGMSDRVMVVREGEVRGILEREEANQETIMILSTGGKLDEK